MIVGELNSTLRRILSEDERVMILGEDLADPYGGAFKVTKGLSTLAPDRVLSTPVSEGAIVGIAAGLALEGYRPIVEVMFADFLTLTFDQVMNHITKYSAMYDHKVTCPVIIRSPAGGHRGYGPTHSQSPEKHFLGVPNLLVVALSPYHHPFDIYRQLLRRDEPVLFVEHKLLYPQALAAPADGRVGIALAREHATPTTLPTMSLSWVPPEECTVTVLAYGYSAFLAARVLEQLAIEDEIFAELVVPTQIAPLDMDPIQASLERTGSLVTIEEGTSGWSWGSEVAAQVGRRQFGRLRRPVDVVASEPAIIPARTDHESRMLVGVEHIRRAVREAAA